MTLEDKKLVKNAFKTAAIVVATILGCRFTHGGLTLLVAVAGTWAAFSHKLGFALGCFVFYPFLTIINPAIKGSSTNGMIMRLGLCAMTFGLCMSSARRPGRFVLPIGSICGYIVVAIISSISGYAPLISFMKLINFIALIFGLWLGFKNLNRLPEDAMKIRQVFLGMVCFLIAGSCLTILIPAYGYANDVSMMSSYANSVDDLNAALRAKTGLKLFSGVTNQSQCLAVLMPCAIAWLLCDMIFVERRITKLHTVLILAGLPLIYMTHARVALVTTLAAVVMIYGYGMSKIPVRPKVKRAIQSGMMAGLALVIVVAIVAEVKDRSVTKFLRKTDDLAMDQRSMGEAFSSSRMGLMQESMRDFRSNPLIGRGFQVAWYHEGMKELTFSAPIEKGVLPVMILGETGALGEIAFLVFLAMFYGACISRRYVVTMTLMTCFLATNLGEATFFSPGGVGGILWTLCAGGGFVIDTMVVIRKEEGQRMQMPRMFGGPMVPVHR